MKTLSQIATSQKEKRLLHKTLLTMLVALIFGGFLSQTSPWANAQEADILFANAPVQADRLPNQDSFIIRQRHVLVNFALMAEPDVLPGGTVSGKKELPLNLFADINVTAEIDKIVNNPSGSVSWIGTVKDQASSEVVIVMNDNIMMANISFDNQFFQVRAADGEIHVINEIDQSKFPPELEPIEESSPDPSGTLSPEADQFLPSLENSVEPIAMGDDGSVIKVLVVYTDDARTVAGSQANMEALIDLAISETNTGYANSNVIQRVTLAHAEEVSYDESGFNWSTTLYRLRGYTDGYLDHVHALRDAHEADMVVMIVENTASCGLGYLMTSVAAEFADSPFSLVSRQCATGYYSFAHEMGHNMGSRHDWYVDNAVTPYTYSHGYVNNAASWRTVMAYNTECSDLGWNCTRLNYWSNPNVTYSGAPMGIASGTSSVCSTGFPTPGCDADNHLSLDNTRVTVANFRTDGSGDVVTTYTQDFESLPAGYNTEIEGWYYEDINADNFTFSYISNSYSHTGSKSLFMNTGNAANDWAFSKGLNLENGRTYRVTFWAWDWNSNTALQLAVGSIPNAANMTTILNTWPTTPAVWTQYQEEFTASVDGIHYLGWYVSGSNFGYAIDDITVERLAAPADTDGDGIVDASDNCPNVGNPLQIDLDGDGLGLMCDPAGPDADSDGWADTEDNCPNDANPRQYDFDGDTVGDVCDPAGPDADNDGFDDTEDNCPNNPNPKQYDTDDDGVGNVCEPGGGLTDSDSDGWADGADNCPEDPNPLQYDTDNNGDGTVCDPGETTINVLWAEDQAMNALARTIWSESKAFNALQRSIKAEIQAQKARQRYIDMEQAAMNNL